MRRMAAVLVLGLLLSPALLACERQQEQVEKAAEKVDEAADRVPQPNQQSGGEAEDLVPQPNQQSGGEAGDPLQAATERLKRRMQERQSP